MYEYSYTKL